MGWFSKIENPLISWLSISAWPLFADDLCLHEARKSRFSSLHDCFIRELRKGVRPVDQDMAVLVSPCDAVIGEFGEIQGLEVFQAKGFPYLITELLGDEYEAGRYQNGRFITLRLKSSMYHRFHAPCAARVSEITYISGDTWNVNPIALKVIERLFCSRAQPPVAPDMSWPPPTVTVHWHTMRSIFFSADFIRFGWLARTNTSYV